MFFRFSTSRTVIYQRLKSAKKLKKKTPVRTLYLGWRPQSKEHPRKQYNLIFLIHLEVMIKIHVTKAHFYSKYQTSPIAKSCIFKTFDFSNTLLTPWGNHFSFLSSYVVYSLYFKGPLSIAVKYRSCVHSKTRSIAKYK